MLDNILKSASALGACERLDKVKNFHSLTSLFLRHKDLNFAIKTISLRWEYFKLTKTK